MKASIRCLSLSLLFLIGCATQAPIRRSNWHYETGVAALLRSAIDDFHRIQDLRAEAKITYEQGGQRDKGAAGLLYRKPDMLRLEVHGGPFSSPIMTVLLEPDSLTVISREGHWKAAATSSALASLVDLDLGDYDLTYALLGMVEPLGPDSVVTLEYPRADLLVATVVGDGRRRRLWIDLFRGFVTREEVGLPGGDTLVRELGDYDLVAGAYLPQLVEIRQGPAALTLDYRRFTPNTGLPAAKLTKGIP